MLRIPACFNATLVTFTLLENFSSPFQFSPFFDGLIFYLQISKKFTYIQWYSKLNNLRTECNLQELAHKHKINRWKKIIPLEVIKRKWTVFPIQRVKYEFEIVKCRCYPGNVFQWDHSNHHVYTWQSSTTEWLVEHSLLQYHSIDGLYFKNSLSFR